MKRLLFNLWFLRIDFSPHWLCHSEMLEFPISAFSPLVRALGNLRYGRPLDSSQWEGSCETAGTDHLHLLPRPHGPQGYLPGTWPTGDQGGGGDLPEVLSHQVPDAGSMISAAPSSWALLFPPLLSFQLPARLSFSISFQPQAAVIS